VSLIVGICVGIEHQVHARQARRELLEHLHSFPEHRIIDVAKAGDVLPWMRNARDKALGDRVIHECEHQWRRACGRLESYKDLGAIGKNGVESETREFDSKGADAIGVAVRPAILDAKIAGLDPAKIGERLAEYRKPRLRGRIALG